MEIEFHSEKQLEDYLYWRMTNGFCPVCDEQVDAAYRQVDMGGYGIVDLVSVKYEEIEQETGEIYMPDTVRIYELKKGAIDLDAIAQIARYKKAIDRFLDKTDSHLRKCDVQYYLVGNGISLTGDACYLADSIEWLKVCDFTLRITSGIEFETSGGWYSRKEDFAKLGSFVENIFKGKKNYTDSAVFHSEEAA